MLTPGTRLGPYEILSSLGAGGMGEVYRARDIRLQRDVAVKVLPGALALDADRIARLQREALVLASLNHPNIATIHGLEEGDGVLALVLELIDGPTLADRIGQGPMPLDEALGVARHIADALQAAHDHGAIHRDLKPANIKVRPDGTVKVLDFGLAKLVDGPAKTGPYVQDVRGARLQADLSNSPTMMESMPGLLLGTAAYMSPEQAKGHEADRLADVWAFGCVLFEMITGRQVFEGGTSSEVLASVLKSEPDWQRLPASTPEAARRLLRRCLQKDDRLRLRDIGDARLEIDEAGSERLSPRPAAKVPLRHTERLAWGAAVAVLAALAAAIGMWAVRPASSPPLEVRFDINTPAVSTGDDLVSLALAPDAKKLVFVGNSDGQPQLWLRPLDAAASRPLPGTAGAQFPFWSPDSRSVAFFADGLLKRLDLDGGLVRTLTRATYGYGGAWNRDGVILFSPNPASPIYRIAADGGTPKALTRLEAGHAGHSTPRFLPDGSHFLYYVTANPESRGIYVGHIDGSPPRKLFDADSGAVYADGYLMFNRQAIVFAQAFDADRLELKGSASQVADSALGGAFGSSTVSAVQGGAIALRAGAARFAKQFVWLDRSGAPIESVGDALAASVTGMSPSPDGSHLVFFQRGDTSSDLWMLEMRRGVLSRFTAGPAEEIFPVWSRDGSRIVFSSGAGGQSALYQKRTAGSDSEELLLPAHPEETFASDTSPDGQRILFDRRSVKTGWDIWTLPLGGEPKPALVIQTDADERGGVFSPDGKWLAYIANSSGPFEVYLQPFPGPGPRSQVSTKGGAQLRWRADGRELFYIALDGKLMAAPVQTGSDGRSVNVGTPVALFTTQVGRVINCCPNVEYAPSADGKRFLMNNVVQDAGGAPIRIILNWKVRP